MSIEDIKSTSVIIEEINEDEMKDEMKEEMKDEIKEEINLTSSIHKEKFTLVEEGEFILFYNYISKHTYLNISGNKLDIKKFEPLLNNIKYYAHKFLTNKFKTQRDITVFYNCLSQYKYHNNIHNFKKFLIQYDTDLYRYNLSLQ